MRILLEILSGSQAGKKIPLNPGKPLRVGRTSKGDYTFPDDRLMSGVHLVLECDENACRIRDVSTNGTFVNGKRITHADLMNGDKIVAGQTRFSVRFEKDDVEAPPRSSQPAPFAPLPQRIAPLPVAPLPPPRLAAPVLPAPVKIEPPPVPATPQERLLALLRGELQPLYALLDAAVEPDVLKVLYESKEERQSLFEGVLGARLVHFAPHLVRLPKESPLLETLVQKAWGKNWGIYIACARPLAELRAHLRQFLEVRVPGNREMHFRYYDPRILRVFLPTCLPDEINQFFGPVKYFVTEDKNPDVLLRFSNNGHGVDLKPVLLAPQEKAQGT
jgi:pSer/pThr/pTyr-binding forkhead associated (FHA) protein